MRTVAEFAPATYAAVQSSRLAEFGGLGMSFNICRGNGPERRETKEGR